MKPLNLAKVRKLTLAQLTLWLLSLSAPCKAAAAVNDSSRSGQTWKIEAVMPEHPAPPETYLCMRVELPDATSLKLTGIEPLSHEALVHHMLLFGTHLTLLCFFVSSLKC